MTVQQQAQLANLDPNYDSTTDSTILQDWYVRLDALWKQYGQNFTTEELAARDQVLLQELVRDLPRFSNTPAMAEQFVLSVGHMNTQDGELALCKLILESHPTGSIGTRVRPITERRERERAESALGQAFKKAPAQDGKIERAENDSDFAALEPSPKPFK